MSETPTQTKHRVVGAGGGGEGSAWEGYVIVAAELLRTCRSTPPDASASISRNARAIPALSSFWPRRLHSVLTSPISSSPLPSTSTSRNRSPTGSDDSSCVWPLAGASAAGVVGSAAGALSASAAGTVGSAGGASAGSALSAIRTHAQQGLCRPEAWTAPPQAFQSHRRATSPFRCAARDA
jgi:hypothetical protein